ncbi:hypothetical protein BJ741DRAFT_260374 [Chytriomyces cf. hyalinus JEL632]|nr:hypothetical protein BJ741DRAFT_260374 [Chytriomyces cf. hyalinus JEL632]
MPDCKEVEGTWAKFNLTAGSCRYVTLLWVVHWVAIHWIAPVARVAFFNFGSGSVRMFNDLLNCSFLVFDLNILCSADLFVTLLWMVHRVAIHWITPVSRVALCPVRLLNFVLLFRCSNLRNRRLYVSLGNLVVRGNLAFLWMIHRVAVNWVAPVARITSRKLIGTSKNWCGMRS